MKDRTSIVIAHHLATIMRANTIYVVKDAKIDEHGTPRRAAGRRRVLRRVVQHPVWRSRDGPGLARLS